MTDTFLGYVPMVSYLEPKEPGQCYETESPNGILHIGIKKLGRGERLRHQVTSSMCDSVMAQAPGGSYRWMTTHALDSPECSPTSGLHFTRHALDYYSMTKHIFNATQS